jgi:hypothetical protein
MKDYLPPFPSLLPDGATQRRLTLLAHVLDSGRAIHNQATRTTEFNYTEVLDCSLDWGLLLERPQHFGLAPNPPRCPDFDKFIGDQ